MTFEQRRAVRRLAMQALYAMDLGGDGNVDAFDCVASAADDEAHGGRVSDEALFEPAAALARDAWITRADADAAVADLAPEWPTHRQPPVDRAILRLGYHELAAGLAPPAVVINEAVELAKRFGAENSPGFVNGVLDKLARQLDPPQASAAEPDEPEPQDADAWLADAVADVD